MGGAGGQAQGALGNLMQPYSEEFFQKAVVDPTMTQYRQQILPEIQQQFNTADAGSSSALNQALSQSAGSLANMLAGQRLGLQQQTQAGQLGGLGFLGGALGQRAFQPLVQQGTQGILGDVLSLLGTLGGAYLGRPTGAVAGGVAGKGLPAVR